MFADDSLDSAIPSKKFFTIKEVADLLQVSESHIYALTSCGDMTFYKIRGRKLILREDLFKYLQAHRSGGC